MFLSLYFAVLLGTLLQIVASSPAQFSSNHSLRRDDIDPDWPYSLHTVSLMLAPYANVGAFTKEWRSRAPPTYRGFGNQSSTAIASNNQSSAIVAFNRNPQVEILGGLTGGSDSGGSGSATNAGKVFGIVFGTFGGIVLISGILGGWLLIRYLRKMRGVADERASDIPVEHVDEGHISPDSTYGSLTAPTSPNAPVQRPEHRVRRANSPSAIDGPTSTPSSPPPSGAVVENWVDGVILPCQPGGVLAARLPPTTMICIEEKILLVPYENAYRGLT
ncbi:hypothetical protein KCU86_g8970, partial [Aureobasidium melanogenum]